MEADPNDLTIGTILFFLANAEIPEEWEVFDGRFLEAEEHQDLYEALCSAPEVVHNMWNQIGGEITIGGITLPDMNAEHARAAMFGENPHPKIDIVLAIKAHRGGNS